MDPNGFSSASSEQSPKTFQANPKQQQQQTNENCLCACVDVSYSFIDSAISWQKLVHHCTPDVLWHTMLTSHSSKQSKRKQPTTFRNVNQLMQQVWQKRKWSIPILAVVWLVSCISFQPQPVALLAQIPGLSPTSPNANRFVPNTDNWGAIVVKTSVC